MSFVELEKSVHAMLAEQGADPDALRKRYRRERDKRLRPEHNEQYVELKGDFSNYVDDPHVAPGFERAPIDDEVEVLVIGGGFAGLTVGAELRKAGIQDIRFIDKAGDFGGTWYWNRYPGVHCDIESYIYMPLLDETGYVPSRKFAPGAEILEHAHRIAKHFDLYRDTCFQTQVTELRWDEAVNRWVVSTNRGDTIRARFVVQTHAPLDRPKLPGIPGIENFKGHTFHTSRWDYDYTGGDQFGGLEKLADKRVAVVGTGATAIQCIPFVGESAGHLYVVQRTPSCVDARNNQDTDPAWKASLKPGWQRERQLNFLSVTTGGNEPEDMVNDGWTNNVRAIGGTYGETIEGVSEEESARVLELRDFVRMNELRARIDTIVEDKATAEKLKPWYRLFCKRPVWNDEYYPTFNRPNVSLIDTDGRGIERITENAVVVDGVNYEVDCIIFATGFEVGTGWKRVSGFETYGRAGLPLSEHWRDGMRTFHGHCSSGFPNLFFTGITQNGINYNYLFGVSEQAVHIAAIIGHAHKMAAVAVEASPEAEAHWVDTIHSLSGGNVAFFKECTPGYFNNEGDPTKTVGIIGDAYGGRPGDFYDMIRTWRAGEMRELTFTN